MKLSKAWNPGQKIDNWKSKEEVTLVQFKKSPALPHSLFAKSVFRIRIDTTGIGRKLCYMKWQQLKWWLFAHQSSLWWQGITCPSGLVISIILPRVKAPVNMFTFVHRPVYSSLKRWRGDIVIWGENKCVIQRRKEDLKSLWLFLRQSGEAPELVSIIGESQDET